MAFFYSLKKKKKAPVENFWLHSDVNSLVKFTAHKLSYFFIQIYGPDL